MIYFTSDLHFGHDKEFVYKDRGYNSILEHDEDVVARFNSVVSKGDDVYILGDLILDGDSGLESLKKLNGHLHLIIGNHDTANKIAKYGKLKNLVVEGYAHLIKYKKHSFYLSHYPTLTGNGQEKKKLYCLCGHIHTKDRFEMMDENVYHVELDCHDKYPVSIDDIIEDIRTYNNGEK